MWMTVSYLVTSYRVPRLVNKEKHTEYVHTYTHNKKNVCAAWAAGGAIDFVAMDGCNHGTRHPAASEQPTLPLLTAALSIHPPFSANHYC